MKIDHHPGSGHPGTEKPGVNGEITVGGNQPGHPHKPGHGPKKPHGSHPSRPHPKPEKEKEHTIQQIVKQTGTNEKDLHQAVEQNQNSKSGADGWFILITQQAGAPKSPETTKKITKIIDSNQDQIKEKVKSGDWEGLIILLKQQSDEQGVDIDWEKVLGDSKNSSFWKMILLKWANTPQQEVHSLDVDNWVTGDSDLAASRANSIILIIRENQEEVQKMVQEGRTDELQQFLEQKAQEKGIDADWQDLDFSNPQSEGGQWFQIIRTNADKQPQELKPDQFYKDISEQFDGGEGMGSLSDFTNGFRSGFWQTLGSGSGSGGLSSLFGSLGRGGGKSETGGFLSNLGLGGGSSGGQGGMLGGMLGGGGSQSGGQGGGKGSSYSWSSSSGDQGSGEGGSSGGLLGGLGGGSGGSGGSGLLGRFGLGK